MQSIPGWLWSWLLGVLLTMLAIALLAMLAGALIRRLARFWWLAFGVCLVAIAIVFQALAPVVIEPMFADFTKAPAGELRSDVEALAKKSGVDSGEIYTVDAANRTTGANAYVTGLGATKRVVIYDTLINDFTPIERKQVIAHEFAHAHYRDLFVGLMWFAFVALIALFAVDLMGRALAERRGVEFESPAGIAMVLAVAMLAIAISQPAANAWSRAIEAARRRLRATRHPAARSCDLTRATPDDPEPLTPATACGASVPVRDTPDAVDRIGMAVTVQRDLAKGRVEPLP